MCYESVTRPRGAAGNSTHRFAQYSIPPTERDAWRTRRSVDRARSSCRRPRVDHLAHDARPLVAYLHIRVKSSREESSSTSGGRRTSRRRILFSRRGLYGKPLAPALAPRVGHAALRVDRFPACKHRHELLNPSSPRICAFRGRDPVGKRIAVLAAEALEHRLRLRFGGERFYEIGRHLDTG